MRCIRVADKQWDRIRVAASRKGVTVSQFIREAALSAC
jgi:uncharacterized protein (DUF1778 family)